ncbi:MAG TPA: MoxR family ATPase [Anaeromyxobacter sp.]|nr:MoxR family ATPase [Anaeromyxobacter sp.]
MTTTTLSADDVRTLCDRILDEVERAVIGKREVLRLVLAAFLCPGGHVLVEDNPGLAKTLVASSFAAVLGLDFKRIQFTPDLLPGDVTGGYAYDTARGRFELRRGPIFTHLLLADEINRASPKTQSALLEAMQEHHVTLEGTTLDLPEPFMVIATQNPIEYEGTFPLPEAQLDRFLVKLSVGYPAAEEEDEILRRRAERREDRVALRPVTDAAALLAMRAAVEEVHVEPVVRRYMVDLAAATRGHKQVVVGASPRGSLALLKLARAWAALEGRAYALPDDVKRVAPWALSHRIVLDPGLWSIQRSDRAVVEEAVRTVPVPVLEDRP